MNSRILSLRRLDDVSWNRVHTAITIALGVGWLLDAFEVTIVNNVISVFKTLWHLSNTQASWILSIWFVGIMVGAYGFGYLADRYGRKRLFLLTLLLYGTFTFLTAFAWDYASMMVLRFVTAIGVGAEYAAINAAISEFIPARHRGKTNATVMNFWSIGAILAALVTLLLINQLPTDIGWRAAFGFGAVVAVAAAFARRYIPESPRWLLAHGDTRAASAIIDDIERGRFSDTRLTGKQDFTPEPTIRRNFWSQSRELIRMHPGRLALGCALDFSEAAGYYGLFAFLALFILPAVHVDSAFVPWFYLIGNVGALAGGLIVATLLDSAGRKITVPVSYALAAVGVLLMAAAMTTHDWRWVLAAFTLANLFATGSWVSAYPTFSEIFPTQLRSTGIGISVAVGRIGAFTAPLLLTYIADTSGMIPALLVLASFWLIGAVAMVPWYFRGVEGKGKALEAMVNALAVPSVDPVAK
ncbi:MFS transporter [Burkholderia multivorans]|jgi:MFS family permease|uniref:MFS transporter n=1 Tax=Paraburkholderia tagetis TaxID=2913261 RepID=A0A9X1RKY7_9BURK|nr:MULTISPECIES: MFS transporter [Burkholderiaceae]MBU6486902.1 MFS transporter [Burkholderiales bacterium]ERJ39854.1 Niacin transporter NiaP [Burkholderia sp. AU4i]MBU9146460.1 MFS transporter [Burkholderia multivorans]MBU9539782.1 MFS transporter [Burkholderia multivorans]MCG5072380.1 MFS transporter [Paraburkholderia tagetis]